MTLTTLFGRTIRNRDLLLLGIAILLTLGSFQSAAQIEIATIEELQLIGNDPAYPLDGHYILTQDIDASDTADWDDGAGFEPIGLWNPEQPELAFTGTFDGQGYVITDLHINRSSETREDIGLFGVIGHGGLVTNLGLEGGAVTGELFDVTDVLYVGALVGWSYGTVSGCYATTEVTGDTYVGGLVGVSSGAAIVTQSYAASLVTGNQIVGGLIGYNRGATATESYATSNVLGNTYVGGLAGWNDGTITDSYATSLVEGDSDVGGLVGWNDGSDALISRCYAASTVTGNQERVGGLIGSSWDGTISQNLATGQVTGNQYAGGLMGWNNSTLTTSYATGPVSGQFSVGGLVGLNVGSLSESYATGDATGASSVGGLIGWNEGTVSNTYAMGAATGGANVGGLLGWNDNGSVSNSYSTGEVTGDADLGGLVGTVANGSITASFWDVDTSGLFDSPAGTGLSTTDMQTLSTFTGADWNFVSIWVIDDGESYPYLQAFASLGRLQVTLEPSEARDEGAQWRRVDTTMWRNSMDMEPWLSPGIYTVEFKDVSGWNTPDPQQATVVEGLPTFLVGTYTQMQAGTGSLRMILDPAEARQEGAQWRRVGTETWRDSNTAEPNVPAGTHEVEFRAISGWLEPDTINITVVEGETITETATYELLTGSLGVLIEPAGAVTDGAQWRRVGTDAWLDSGDTEPDVRIGDHDVEFRHISGWITPDVQTVTINIDETTETTGTYVAMTADTGALRVFIEPQEAVDDGGQWRRVGTETWNNSGVVEWSLPVGLHEVEFRDIAGWTTPDNENVSISDGEIAQLTGVYVRLTYTLTYDSGDHGTIEGETTQVVEQGSDGTPVQVIPNEGYHFVQWSDGSTDNPRTDTNVTEDISVTAEYAVNEYTLTYEAGPNGSLEGETTQVVEHGSNGSPVLAISDEDYHFVQWSDGSTDNPRTDTNVTDNISVTAEFAINTGALQVFIEPEEAIVDGAQWRRVNTLEWNEGGDIESDIPVGEHDVEFRDVNGWITPDVQTVTIESEETTELIGTYVAMEAETGGLRVFIGPQDAVNAGAQWRRVDTDTWRDSGTAEWNLPVGSYEVEFRDVSGWNTPNPATVTIEDRVITYLEVEYSVMQAGTGSLRMILEPAEAREAGAQWRRVGTTTWRESNTIESDLSPDNYDVEFRPVDGWETPNTMTVTVVEGETVTETATYVINVYTLTYTAGPNGSLDGETTQFVEHGSDGTPVEASPDEGYHFTQWSDGSTDNPRTDTNVTEDISVTAEFAINEYTLTYEAGLNGSLDGETTQVVEHGSNGSPVLAISDEDYHFIQWSDGSTDNPRTDTNVTEDISVTASFSINTGALQVFIEPEEAIDGGAQWRRVGTDDWNESGDTESDIPVGDYEVEFQDIEDWITPEAQPVTINQDETTELTGAYEPMEDATGALRVTIEPQAVVDAGAQWRRVGTETWQDNDATEWDVPVDEHEVEFRDVDGWNTPDPEPVMLEEGEITTLEVEYTPMLPGTGSLRMMLEPAGARQAGAQWRRVGTDTWRNSNTAEPNVPPGDHQVEFRSVDGWSTPSTMTVTVVEGQTVTDTATYTVPTGSLQVNIAPDGAVDAGARWRRVGRSTWRPSGDVESNVPVGDHQVEFRSISGWNTPGNITVSVPAHDRGVGNATYTVIPSSDPPGCGFGKMADRLAIDATTVYEPAFPAIQTEDGTRIANVDANLAVRLRSEEPIDPMSVWGMVSWSTGYSEDVSFVYASEEDDTDGWAVFAPEANWTPGDEVSFIAGAETVSGAQVELVSFTFVVSDAASAADATLTSAPAHHEGIGMAWSIGPDALFDEPVTVQIPVPTDLDAADLGLGYLFVSEAGEALVPADRVEGWLVPDSLRVVTDADGDWVELTVRHGGVVQLRQRAAKNTPAGLSTSIPQGNLAIILLAMASVIGLAAARKRRMLKD